MELTCNYCETNLKDIKTYIFHLETIHQIRNYFTCPYKNCKRTYSTKSSFKYHLQTNNHAHTSNNITSSVSTIDSTRETINGHDTNCIPEQEPNIGNHSYCEQNVTSEQAITNILEMFICHLYSNINLPRSVVQTIFELVENFVHGIIAEIDKTLNNSSYDSNKKIDILQETLSFVKSSFTNLDTEYKRTKHFTGKETYIQPKSVTLGTSTERSRENNNILMTIKEQKLYMAPLKLTLKKFLELPDVLNQICNYQQLLLAESAKSNNTIIRNVVQGTLWQKVLSSKPTEDVTIPLILYFDDFESGNPLGSHAGQYKLGAVYVSIATIPPNKSSRLENIFLTQLFYSTDRSNFGNGSVFRSLIEELKLLEEFGIPIELADMAVTVKFVIIALSGDNLGLHGILGLFESFMATNFCRFCLTTKTGSETQILEDNNLRQVAEYDSDILNRKGVKETCVWNDLPSFHIYENLTCDVMHDLMEGVHRYSMAHIIDGLINKQYFTLDQLNSRLKYLEYHSSEKNKPPPVINQHIINKSIIMSATEMLCLVRNFVFMVGDLVDPDEPIWKYYLLLLEITVILTSQTYTSELLEYLQYIISEHHQQYLSLFSSKLKPKHHFLLHYPRIIKKIGPPILISAFKYESKHKELKNVCQSITSRKDLPLSVFKRCQLKQSLRLVSKKGLPDYIHHGRINFSEIPHVNNKDQTLYVEWYELNGIRYTVNDVLLYNVTENIPEFYIIRKIIFQPDVDELLFDCFYLKSTIYNPHFNAYKVVKTSQTKQIKYKDLYTNQPVIVHNVGLDHYVKID